MRSMLWRRTSNEVLRQKGLFMLYKTRFLFLVFLLLLCACQPTPEEEYVVNRGDHKIEEQIEATPVPEENQTVALPESTNVVDPALMPFLVNGEGQSLTVSHWDDMLGNDNMKIKIDADVITANQTTFPVYRIEQHSISKEQYRTIFSALIPDAVKVRTQQGYAYEDYEAELAASVRGAEKRSSDGTVKYVSWNLQQNAIDSARRNMQNAPHKEYTDVNLDLPTGILLLNDGTEAQASYNANRIELSRNFYGIIQPLHWEVNELWDADRSVTYRPKISQENAVKQAEAFLETVGIEGVNPAYSEPCRMFNGIDLSVLNEGYIVYFVRTNSYASYFHPAPIDDGGFLRFDEDSAYSAKLKTEQIEVYVTENGVQFFLWENPYSVEECLNENVQLLPFEQVQKDVRRLLLAGIGHVDGFSATHYCMTKMILTVAPQRLSNGKTVLAPIWLMAFDFYWPDFDTLTIPFTEKYRQSTPPMLLAVSAIDGSRVTLE